MKAFAALGIAAAAAASLVASCSALVGDGNYYIDGGSEGSGPSLVTDSPMLADEKGGGNGSGASGGGSSGSSGVASGSASSSGGGSGGSSSGGTSSTGGSSSGVGSSSGSSGGTGSSGGSSSSGSSSGAGSSGGSSSSGAVSCATTSTGGIALATNYLTPTPGVIGMGGYAYSYQDLPFGGSTACLNPNMLCGKGTTAALNPPTYTIYGAGIGVNLNQTQGSTVKVTFAATGSGIAYALSNLPMPSTRLLIDNAGADYCTKLTTAAGTVPWAMFTPQCYNLPGGDAGADLAGAPAFATHIEFQVDSDVTAGSFDFCVTSLGFM
jgi:hypothetical protein